MAISTNMKRIQKTKDLDWLVEVGLETRGKQGVYSDLSAMSNLKTKSEFNTEHLLERIVDKRNIFEAYKKVVSNKGSHGIDGMKVDELLPFLQEHYETLKTSLLSGKYKPQPVRRKEIPKPNGGVRLLGIPTVIDRLIQQAINQVINPIFDKEFSDSSYGFRPKRSTHMALKQAQKYIDEGYRYVIDMDLEKFFDNINHDLLMHLVSRKIEDKRVLKLIRKYLKSGIMLKGMQVKSEEGAPQGGPLSPLLSNILLDELDKELERRGHRFCRYADDCNVYVKSKRAGERALENITKFLEKELKLKVNTEKSAVSSPTKRKFLGYSFYYGKGGIKFRVHDKSYDRLKEKIRNITNRNVSMNFNHRIKKLNEIVVGWVNYFKLADMKTKLKELDQWIRRRLRAVVWKTWKLVRTRFKNLMKLGVPKGKAWEYANTRKSYWRISKSPILNKTITNQKLINHGFKSLTSQYEKFRLS
ncbi:Group II intron, maturase-specific domain [Proteiniborus ethanoligenes]|uniref:RNA-directed DNA polymerase n=1 Tax=Proteiniborus ethanoligenes TaxID=415015 RepID=A0A1H3P3F9_9FIRM|nr:group II intron reverse transcriptase/maturase [Proteiniborus ethanoligenes]SDY71427.1 Group II intron, maturase-specific domain [Proteiniborus ethanoligenes]SDY95513.1 Group II intron, maturase-specific domain [Proteiniborus ethanoligenes]SDY98818.1 Group II intron, maturase-specific domain [Proteiniborus ethanoligenes]